jgi:hypothetical protein
MQTEFTCGIYRATPLGNQWGISVNQYTLATVSMDGKTIKFADLPVHLSVNDLIEIAVLMNNIKRQYKQHANTTNP